MAAHKVPEKKINASSRSWLQGQKYAMYIILPEEKDGLQHLIKTVNPFQLRKYIWQTEETPTEVILPKFMFKYKTDLKPILRKVTPNCH